MDDTVCPGGPVEAPFLFTRQTTLGTAQSGLRAAQGTGIRHGLPGVGHQLRQQAQVNPHHLACGRQRDRGHGAGDHHVPALAHAIEGRRGAAALSGHRAARQREARDTGPGATRLAEMPVQQ
jgi:hypothetical protein